MMPDWPGFDPKMLQFLRRIRPFIITAHALAILPTLFRLHHRFRTRKLWWDDFWAAFSLVFDILLLSMYLSFPITRLISERAITVVHWTTMFSLNFSLWAARISVSVTIVRLSNPGRMRQVSKCVTVLFGMLALSLLIQKVFLCGVRPTLESWKCVWPLWTGIMEITTDILTDGWLTLAPLYMLWHMNLPRRHFRLLQAIFACAIFVTGAGIAHGVFIIERQYLWMTSLSHFEIAISLIVCNLLVVVTYMYKVFWSTGETRIESTEETPRVPTEDQCTQIRAPSIPIRGLTVATVHTGRPSAGVTGVSSTGSISSSATPSSFLTLTTVEIYSSEFDSNPGSRSYQYSLPGQSSDTGRQDTPAASTLSSAASQPEARS